MDRIFVLVRYGDEPGIEEVIGWSTNRDEIEARAKELHAEEVAKQRAMYLRHASRILNQDTVRWYQNVASRPDEEWTMNHECIELAHIKSATRSRGEVRR